MTDNRDIVIAGGGMVGVSLALQLAHSLPTDVSICLIEGFPFPSPVAGSASSYHPSFDARSTALSYSSRRVYEEMGVWGSLKEWLCPIESIHVSSRGRFGSTLMRSADYDWDALGYVVENSWLGNALIQALYRQDRVEVISPARVIDVQAQQASTRLCLEGAKQAEIHAQLLLVADGAASGLRQQLGVAANEKPYRQHALVANIASSEAHNGCAFERFTDEGPLALLPLLSVAGAPHRSALVWTVSAQEAEHLQQCPEEEFLATLQRRFGYRLGRLLQVGERHSYPLSLIRSGEQVRKGVVVMGNAAHALHPVAGQGYNLALRDVAELARVLSEGISQGLPLGDLGNLQRYEQRQQQDQERTIQFSDRVPALFMQSDPIVGLARDLALSGLDLLPSFKRGFVRYAAGVSSLDGAANV